MPADPKGEKRPTELRSRRKGRPESRPLACDRRSYAALATSSSARRDSKSARSNATHHYARQLVVERPSQSSSAGAPSWLT
jgi:hypothetical protein